MDSLQHFRDQRIAALWQARALRAAIPRQASTSIAELMRCEAERLEAIADDCRGHIERLQEGLEARRPSAPGSAEFRPGPPRPA